MNIALAVRDKLPLRSSGLSFKVPAFDALVYSAAGLLALLIGSWVPDERLVIGGVPFNTALLALVVMLATTGKVSARAWHGFLLFQIPLVLLAASLLWSPDPIAGADKWTTMLLSANAAFVCFNTVVEKHGAAELARLLFWYFSILLLGAFVYKLLFGFFRRQIPFLFNGAIVFARLMCIAALLAAYFLKGRTRNIVVAIFFAAVVWTESKGPILALTLTFFAAILWRASLKQRIAIISISAAAIAMLVLAAQYYGVEARDIGRLGVLYGMLVGDFDVLNSSLATGSIETRTDSWIKTLELIPEKPLGVGLGGWSTYVPTVNRAIYPHNLFLELWSEVGILLGTIAAIPFVAFLFARRNIFWYIAFTLFLAQMVSGDLGDARFLLAFSMLALFSSSGADPFSVVDANQPLRTSKH